MNKIGKDEYYVIVDIRELGCMAGGYTTDDIAEADTYPTVEAARNEIETFDEPQYFEVYKVEQEVVRRFQLVPKQEVD